LATRPLVFGDLLSPVDAKSSGKGNGLYHYVDPTSGMIPYFDTDRSAGYYITPEYTPA
jgi:hypothetical protein